MARMKDCFVIMPIRKPGTEDYEHFRALRDTVIEPAIKALGYTVTRADDITKSGAITADIIRRLATADLVVADLTDLNANVFYELGVRHTLRGQGTIMVIDTSRTSVPFDLAPYRVIEFTPNLRGIEKLRDMLVRFANAIAGEAPDPSKDNPVHDFLPSLPSDIFAHVEGSVEGGLRQEIARLQEQLRRYAERYGTDIDLLDRSHQRSATDAISLALAQAQRGELPVDLFHQARGLAREGDRTRFLTILRQLIEASPSAISAANWSDLASDAVQLALPDVAMVLHERAVELRPTDRTLREMQLSTLAHSEDPLLRERARSELSSYLGIQVDGESVSLPEHFSIESLTALGIMLDAYHADGLDDAALAITSAAVERFPHSAIALRNHGRALSAAGRFKEALEYHEAAVQAPDVDAITYVFFAEELVEHHERERAIIPYLRACEVDPDEPDWFARVAIELAWAIRERSMVRRSEGRNLAGDVDSSTVVEFLAATFSCPTVTQDAIDNARVAVDTAEIDEGMFTDLTEIRRGARESEADEAFQFMNREQRLNLVRSLQARILGEA